MLYKIGTFQIHWIFCFNPLHNQSKTNWGPKLCKNLIPVWHCVMCIYGLQFQAQFLLWSKILLRHHFFICTSGLGFLHREVMSKLCWRIDQLPQEGFPWQIFEVEIRLIDLKMSVPCMGRVYLTGLCPWSLLHVPAEKYQLIKLCKVRTASDLAVCMNSWCICGVHISTDVRVSPCFWFQKSFKVHFLKYFIAFFERGQCAKVQDLTSKTWDWPV